MNEMRYEEPERRASASSPHRMLLLSVALMVAVAARAGPRPPGGAECFAGCMEACLEQPRADRDACHQECAEQCAVGVKSNVEVNVTWNISGDGEKQTGALRLALVGHSEPSLRGEFPQDRWTRLYNAFSRMSASFSFRMEHYSDGQLRCGWRDGGRFSLSETSTIDKENPWATPILLARTKREPRKHAFELAIAPKTRTTRRVAAYVGACPPLDILDPIKLGIQLYGAADVRVLAGGQYEWWSPAPPFGSLAIWVREHAGSAPVYQPPDRGGAFRYRIAWAFPILNEE